MDLNTAREGFLDAMRQGHQEMRTAMSGRHETPDVALYRRMTPDMLDEMATQYGPEATIEYVLAMEKEAAHGNDQ